MSPKQKKINRGTAPAVGTAKGQGGGPGADTGRVRSTSAEDRRDTPPQPISRISKDDTTQECWCGCQEPTSPDKRWRPGHDQRAKGIIRRAIKEGKAGELSPQLKEYARERGLI